MCSWVQASSPRLKLISLHMMSFNVFSYCSKIKFLGPMINCISSLVRSNIDACFLIINRISSLMWLWCWNHLDTICIWWKSIATWWLECLLQLTWVKSYSWGSLLLLLWWDWWLLILLIAVIIKTLGWVYIRIIYFIEIASWAWVYTCVKILMSSSIDLFDWLGKSGCRLVPVLICIHS